MVWAHGYVQWHGAKMSKTAGTAVNLHDAIERHGPDPLRYFLMREVGFEADGDFTWERFDARYTADLADGLGNLVARSLAMIDKYRDGVVPVGPASDLDAAALDKTIPDYIRAMDELDLQGALEATWGLVTAADQFISANAPWSHAKAGRDAALDGVLASLARTIYRLAVLSTPFFPTKASATQAEGQLYYLFLKG
jgi:methionyl-tRNA synthetase